MRKEPGKGVDPVTGEKIRAHDVHAPGVSRRNLVKGAAAIGGTLLGADSVFGMLTGRPAYAVECAAEPQSGLVPFLVFDMQGGAGLPGNFLVGKAGGPQDLLRSYDLLGWDPRAANALDDSFGLPMARGVSKLLEGILTTSSAEARARLRFGSMCHFGQDDTSSNPLSALTLVSKAGLTGLLLPKGVGSRNSDSGGNSRPIYAEPTLKPLFVGGINDLLGAISFGRAFQGVRPAALRSSANGALELARLQGQAYTDLEGGQMLADLGECGYLKNLGYTESSGAVDPRGDNIFQQVYQINQQTAVNSPAAVSAGIVMNVLRGNSGPGAIVVEGCDYHDGSQTTGDMKDLAMGQQIGRAVEAAHRLQKPLFFQLITDGGVGAERGARMWTTESGDKSMSVVGYYKPQGAHQLRPNMQIGAYTDGQSADRTTFVGLDASKAAYASFANYLHVCGQLGRFAEVMTAITGSPVFTNEQLDSFLVFA